MSTTYTKINVRSPFYLHLAEPSTSLPAYDCDVAKLTGFAVDNQGVITLPEPQSGIIESIASDDGDFANNKFPAENTDTSRTIKVTLAIPPSLFSNSSDLVFECPVTAIQPGTVSSSVQPSVCSGGPTLNGSIGSQSLTVGGSSVDIDLNGFFNNETIYEVNNINPLIVSTAIQGSVLTISPNIIGGSTTVHAIAKDASFPATCEATQPISVTVTAGSALGCTLNGVSILKGGSITAAGVITDPVSPIAQIVEKSLTNGGSPITSVSARTQSTPDTVKLFYKLTVPSSFTNAGTGALICEVDLIQQGTALPVYDCNRAALTGQQMTRDGSIALGSAAEGGTVLSFTPPDPPIATEVTTPTSHNVTFQIKVPTGFQGPNGESAGSSFNCPQAGDPNIVLIQPPTVQTCGSFSLFISTPANEFPDPTATQSHCDKATTVDTYREIKATTNNIQNLEGTVVCFNGSPFDGRNLFYIVTTTSISNAGGPGISPFKVAQINRDGLVTVVGTGGCPGTSGGQQSGTLF